MIVPLPFRIVGLQLGVVAVVVLLMLLNETKQAGSAVLGGTVVVLPNAFFAYAATRSLMGQGDNDRGFAAMRLLGSGVLKIVLTVMLMAGTLSFVRIDPLGFFAAMMGALFAPMVVGMMNWKRGEYG
jgi:F0F1-type ATP synthase assembly protein I